MKKYWMVVATCQKTMKSNFTFFRHTVTEAISKNGKEITKNPNL